MTDQTRSRIARVRASENARTRYRPPAEGNSPIPLMIQIAGGFLLLGLTLQVSGWSL